MVIGDRVRLRLSTTQLLDTVPTDRTQNTKHYCDTCTGFFLFTPTFDLSVWLLRSAAVPLTSTGGSSRESVLVFTA